MAFATKLPLYGIIIVAVVYLGKLGEPDLIQDKSQAQVITAVIPDREIRIHRFAGLPLTSPRHRYSRYLKADNTLLHCQDHYKDSCSAVYRYSGRTATIHHYDGLAYEIEIDGQKIYEFGAQAKKFAHTQSERNRQMLIAFLLFGLPSWLFSRIAVRLTDYRYD